jgi:hypothetical protein
VEDNASKSVLIQAVLPHNPREEGGNEE